MAERQVLVSADESAVVEVGGGSAGAGKDLSLRLKAGGIPTERRVRQGVAVVSVSRADAAARLAATRPGELAVAPVLFSKGSRYRVVPLPRVVFRMDPGQDPGELTGLLTELGAQNLREVREDEYAADVPSGTNAWSSIQCSARLAAHPGVKWAVPDCAREARKTYVPNDLGGLWHWRNTNAPPHTNDMGMCSAWNTTLGSTGAVIAVMDDGLDLTHPDLAANVWVNPGEIAGDGLDNDTNGYVDDVNGWDFYVGTNDIAPNDADENHGTAVSGLAAARGNNGLGVCGACPQGRIMMVKLWDGNNFVTDLQWADAVYYAQRYAKVISISISSDSALADQLVSAFNAVSTDCVILASAGNDADFGVYRSDCAGHVSYYGWMLYTQQVTGAGSHTYRWSYVKDNSESLQGDCLWLDAVHLPNGQQYNFDDGALGTWTTGGNAPFFFSPSTSDCMVAGAYSLRSGDIGDSQTSWVQVVSSGAGSLSFYYQVFGEMGCYLGSIQIYDCLLFSVDGTTKWTDVNEHPAEWGLSFTNLPFPAALTSVVAVGASTIDGYRATYSQFGTNLEVMAPSGGAAGETGVRTTDRQGADGYVTGDYDEFSGTSASAPIAAGVAALLFSANPHLTAPEVRALLRDNAKKIGGLAYASGFHRFCGYGQISGADSMRMMLSNMPPEIVQVEKSNTQVRFTTVGIETGRTYQLYGASSVNAGGGWNWQLISPAATGVPVFGVNVTPYWNTGASATLSVYQITK
jgi:subtilisin family serine protease